MELVLEHATIGVITALPYEFAAARDVLQCKVELTSSGRGANRNFSLNRIPAKDGAHHVVALMMLADMGNNSAALGAQAMVYRCPNIKYIIMTGIAGAVPDPDKPDQDVGLGDVVVSDRVGVIQYDYSKVTDGVVEYRNPPRPPSPELLEAVRRLKAEESTGHRCWDTTIEQSIARLQKHGENWERPMRGRPRVFVGPIGSANTLLKDQRTRDLIRDRFSVKAIEMEGAGIADAAWTLEVGYLVVRGTSDFCDKNKQDHWQRYAAIIAACFTRAVIERIPSPSSSAFPVPGVTVGAKPSLVTRAAKVVRRLIPTSVANLALRKQPGILTKELPAPSMTPPGGNMGIVVKRTLATKQSYVAPEQDTSGIALPEGQARLEGAPERENWLAGLALKQMMDEIEQHLLELDNDKALASAAELEKCVSQHEHAISRDILVACYELLAQVEVIRIKLGRSKGEAVDTSRARFWIAKGTDAAES